MTAKEAVKKALQALRENLAAASGDELSVLEVFTDELDAELEGLKMREGELRRRRASGS